MSYSYSYTESSTFTVTHARHVAAKVATDLTGCGNSPPSSGEWHVVAMMEADFAL